MDFLGDLIFMAQVGVAAFLCVLYLTKSRLVDKVVLLTFVTMIALLLLDGAYRATVHYADTVQSFLADFAAKYAEAVDRNREWFSEQLLKQANENLNILAINVRAYSVGLFLWVLSAFFICFWVRDSRPRIVSAQTEVKDATFTQEKMMPGSEFQNDAVMPKFQAEVYGSVGTGKYYGIGQAFWVDEGLVTAAHVISEMDSIVIKKDTELTLNREDFIFVDGDLAVYKISAAETQKLGLSKAKLSPMAATKNGGIIANTTAFGKRAAGFVTPNEQFGFCTFSGSTKGGFSGAPYYLNNHVFGMHLGSSMRNVGYEAAYIRSLLHPTKTIRGIDYKGEDSSEWLIDMAGRVNSFDYEPNPFNSDETRVKIAGRYHIVDDEVLQGMLGRAHGKSKVKIQYDFESAEVNQADELPLCPRGASEFAEAGNLFRAPAVIAGARGPVQDQASVPNPAEPTSSRTDLLSRLNLEKSRMVSPTSTPVLQNGVSKTMSQNQKRSLKMKQTKLENLQLKSIIERLSKRSDLTEPGQLI